MALPGSIRMLSAPAADIDAESAQPTIAERSR